MNQALIEFIKKTVSPENIFMREPMDKHTTFRVGGEADVFVQVTGREQLLSIIGYLAKIEEDFFVLGRGSNILVGDKGFRGIILDMSRYYTEIRVEGTCIIAQAGASLPRVAAVAAEHGLSGLEFAAGIPGTIGGAVVMNAGAYDGEMKQVVKKVAVISKSGEEMELDGASMEFGYRTSIIKNRPFVVEEVELELVPGSKEDIVRKGVEFNRRRREKQPLEYPSAGSTFKRPEGYFAGKLIMDAGLRGFRVGGAQVSEKHCGFVINVGNATATDISELMDEVRNRVKERFGVTLEPEVIRIGEF